MEVLESSYNRESDVQKKLLLIRIYSESLPEEASVKNGNSLQTQQLRRSARHNCWRQMVGVLQLMMGAHHSGVINDVSGPSQFLFIYISSAECFALSRMSRLSRGAAGLWEHIEFCSQSKWARSTSRCYDSCTINAHLLAYYWNWSFITIEAIAERRPLKHHHYYGNSLPLLFRRYFRSVKKTLYDSLAVFTFLMPLEVLEAGSTKSYCNPTIAKNFFQKKICKEPFIVKTAHGSSRGNFTTLVPCEKLHVAKEKVIEEKNKDREDLPAIPPEVYVKTVQKQSKTKPKYNKEIIKTVDHELKTAQIIPRHHNTKEKIHLSNIRRPKKFSESVINAWDDTLDRSEVLTKKFGLNITREDLLTLRESNWLNDKIINFYMELIDQRSRQNHKLPTTFSFNTFLYVSLKAGGYSRVKNYTRKTDLFEKDIIFIPIFKAAHWRLITIYIKLQKIEYLDSLGKDGTDILEDIKNYLTEEHNHKKGTPLDTTNWKFTQRTDIPLQQNNDDCGVFVCQYAKSLGSSEEIQIKHSQIPENSRVVQSCIALIVRRCSRHRHSKNQGLITKTQDKRACRLYIASLSIGEFTWAS
ncbi:unnamed protein product [Nesidiocoris tenuis]|uniref:Ubiquitin-like protease family profile domain-containing protein n=1 Tax=Nesidiocoris tenuis TaxID=355587 RepID=A0A6H5GNQ9_9HEMI|nr:unnamed protein product [Nesidiocoris tenuis]